MLDESGKTDKLFGVCWSSLTVYSCTFIAVTMSGDEAVILTYYAD